MLDHFRIGWPTGSAIKAFTTTRQGGCSGGVFAGLNLASHVGDDPAAVSGNRAVLTGQPGMPGEPLWLTQTHSTRITCVDSNGFDPDADGSYTCQSGRVCAVLTADCLPVFIADPSGACAGVFHAGWRGLASGILDNAVSAMRPHSQNLIAALGPAISQQAFEVGDEVRQVFVQKNTAAEAYFAPSKRQDHFYADLYKLARLELNRLGIGQVWMPETVCTFSDADRFFSYRRDGQCGRMASLIWISDN